MLILLCFCNCYVHKSKKLKKITDNSVQVDKSIKTNVNYTSIDKGRGFLNGEFIRRVQFVNFCTFIFKLFF